MEEPLRVQDEDWVVVQPLLYVFRPLIRIVPSHGFPNGPFEHSNELEKNVTKERRKVKT